MKPNQRIYVYCEICQSDTLQLVLYVRKVKFAGSTYEMDLFECRCDNCKSKKLHVE